MPREDTLVICTYLRVLPYRYLYLHSIGVLYRYWRISGSHVHASCIKEIFIGIPTCVMCLFLEGAYTATTGGYFGHMSLSLGVVIVIVLGLAIAIGLLVLAAGLILMKRYEQVFKLQPKIWPYNLQFRYILGLVLV